MIALRKGPMTRGDLVKETGFPRTTIFDAIKKLILAGDVRKYTNLTSNRRGRPHVLYEIVE